jgi:hypothetical protein
MHLFCACERCGARSLRIDAQRAAAMADAQRAAAAAGAQRVFRCCFEGVRLSS